MMFFEGVHPVQEERGPVPNASRLSTWRRRHLHGRAILALIALGSLVGPGVGALVLAFL